jgi:DNA-binding CsgD family transcriptional regulator/predicted transcriptional regulator
MLELLGLSQASDRVYAVLTSVPAAEPEQLVQRTGAPETDIRAALDELEQANLARPGPEGWVACDPRGALSQLIEQREHVLEAARAQFQVLKHGYLRSRPPSDLDQFFEIVSGDHAILARIHELEGAATESLRCLDRPPYREMNLPNYAELDLLQRGGWVRGIYSPESLGPDRDLGVVSRHIAAGEQARVYPDLPTKLMIVDQRWAYLPLHLEDVPGPNFVFINGTELVKCLITMFDQMWAIALPVSFADTAREHTDESERVLVDLLVSGQSDDAIARRLNISRRTLQRRLQSVMDRYGAATRFQLGMQLERRGLLDPAHPPRDRGDDHRHHVA